MQIIDTFYNTTSSPAWLYSGWSQVQYPIKDLLVLRAGLRVDRFDYTRQTMVSPRAGLTLHCSRSTDVSFGYGRHYQLPGWYSMSSGVNGSLYSFVKSEYADHYVADIEQTIAQTLRVKCEGFYKQYADIAYGRHEYLRFATMKSRGIEISAEKKLTKNFWGTVGYALSESKMKDPLYPDITFNTDFDYRHHASLLIGYRHDFRDHAWYNSARRKWWYRVMSFIPGVPSDEGDYSVKWNFLSGRPYTPGDEVPYYLEISPLTNSARMPAYSRLDVHLKQRLFFNKVSLWSYVEIINVLDKNNIWGYEYVNGVRETVLQFPRVVFAGVIFEF